MSLDHVVRLDCEPKRVLGGGDMRRGEARQLACLIARNRAELLPLEAASGTPRVKARRREDPLEEALQQREGIV